MTKPLTQRGANSRPPGSWDSGEGRLRALIENTSELLTVLAPDLTVLFQTGELERRLGYAPGELDGRKFSELVDPHGLAQLRARCADAADGVAKQHVQLRLKCKDGVWLEGETLVRYESSECYLVLVTRDVGERKRAERALKRRAAQQATAARLSAEALAGQELAELMDRACQEIASTLDVDYAAVLEHSPDANEFIVRARATRDPQQTRVAALPGEGTALGRALRSSDAVIIRDWEKDTRFDEAPLARAAGLRSGVDVAIPGPNQPFGVVSVQAREANQLSYDDGVFLKTIANTLAAAINRLADEEKIRHQALHDPLTGMPNRTLFEDRLTQALATESRHGGGLAVLFLDLDSFKRLNDSLGHAIGDEVLSAIAQRIGSSLRAEDTLARLGGDEFAILLPSVDSEEDVVAVVERIASALRVPLTVEGREIISTASVGIALSTSVGAGEKAQALVRAADLAMYTAKQRGPGGWEFFAEHMHETAVQRFDLAGDLRRALERSELEVHYQPIVTLRDEEIVGLEALVRWNHPRHGMLSPGVFLPLAEESGLIVRLGRFVLRTACENLRRWQLAQPRHRDLYMSVNLTTQELRAPDLVDELSEILGETGVVPAGLVLEITEGALLETDAAAIARLEELKGLGIRLAIDDFGTGYSALSYLQSFPMDILKIDKTFVDHLGESGDQERLVKGIIELAHDLGLETVAEGIERADQATALKAMQSELGQGYHFAKPLTPADIDLILQPFSIGTPTKLPHSVQDPS